MLLPRGLPIVFFSLLSIYVRVHAPNNKLHRKSHAPRLINTLPPDPKAQGKPMLLIQIHGEVLRHTLFPAFDPKSTLQDSRKTSPPIRSCIPPIWVLHLLHPPPLFTHIHLPHPHPICPPCVQVRLRACLRISAASPTLGVH